MKNIYGTSLLSFGGIVGGSYIMAPYLVPQVGLFGGLILSLGGIIGFNASQKQTTQVLDINGMPKNVIQYTGM